MFAVCAALRLARFNTQIGVVDKKYFVGLASPPSAAILASIVWTGHSGDVSVSVAVASALITTIAGLLMVSNVRYYSFKDIDFRGRVPFVVMLMVVGVFVVVSINPPVVLLCMSVTYGLSGPVIWLWRRRASLVGWVNSSKEGDESSAQGSAESGDADAPEEVRKEP